MDMQKRTMDMQRRTIEKQIEKLRDETAGLKCALRSVSAALNDLYLTLWPHGDAAGHEERFAGLLGELHRRLIFNQAMMARLSCELEDIRANENNRTAD